MGEGRKLCRLFREYRFDVPIDVDWVDIVYDSSVTLAIDYPGDPTVLTQVSCHSSCRVKHLCIEDALAKKGGFNAPPDCIFMFQRGGWQRGRWLEQAFYYIHEIQRQFGKTPIWVFLHSDEYNPVVHDFERLGCNVLQNWPPTAHLLVSALQTTSPRLPKSAFWLHVKKNDVPVLHLADYEARVDRIRGRLFQLFLYLARERRPCFRPEIAKLLLCPENQVRVHIQRLNHILLRICAETDFLILARLLGREQGWLLQIKTTLRRWSVAAS